MVITDSIVLASFLHSCSNFVPRMCNRVAHVVAKYGLSSELHTTWNGNFSDWVCDEDSLDVPISA